MERLAGDRGIVLWFCCCIRKKGILKATSYPTGLEIPTFLRESPMKATYPICWKMFLEHCDKYTKAWENWQIFHQFIKKKKIQKKENHFLAITDSNSFNTSVCIYTPLKVHSHCTPTFACISWDCGTWRTIYLISTLERGAMQHHL